MRKDVNNVYEMRIYLLNNTKPYREGEEEYSGDWFDCPVDFEEVKEKLGVEHEEQLLIADYELPFHVNTDTSIWEVNENCRKIQEIEDTPVGNEIEAIQKKWFYSFEDFFNNKDEIRYYDAYDGESLARILLTEEQLYGEIPAVLQNHIDYASVGQELEANDEYLFTASGVFRYR